MGPDRTRTDDANWAIIASLIETCKLNAVNPHAWLSDTLTKLVNRWPAARIDELMPWAYATAAAVRTVDVWSAHRLHGCQDKLPTN